MANIIIVDQEEIIRCTLRSWINSYREHKLIEEIEDYSLLADVLGRMATDLLIIEPCNSQVSIAEILNKLHDSKPSTKILAFTNYCNINSTGFLSSLSLNGVVSKSCSESILLTAINKIIRGEVFYCPMTISILKNQSVKSPIIDILTSRELEIIILIAKEYTTKDISKILFISENTVGVHRKNIMKKLSIHTSVGLTKFCIRENLILL